jgi:putative PEP-CTERM system histidine kinase
VTLPSLLPFLAAAFCGGIAIVRVATADRSLANWTFVGGMLALAIERICSGMAIRGQTVGAIESWHQWRLLALAAGAGTWLVFALTYSRGNAIAFLSRWRATLIVAVVVPIGIAVIGRPNLVSIVQPSAAEPVLILRLGLPAVALYAAVLVVSVLVLLNLERTYRAAVGTMRWRIKFVLLGVGVIFVVRIYTGSQTLLFRALDPTLDRANSVGTLIGGCLLVWGLLRARNSRTDVYPSLAVLHGSLTVAVVGVYLLAVGIFAKLVALWGGDASFSLKVFIVLIALVALALLLQSDRVRLQVRQFLSRNFQRPVYDYRAIWQQFTERTTACVESTELCRALVRITADIFQSLAVSIWLVNDRKTTFSLAASTAVSDEKAREFAPTMAEVTQVLHWFQTHADPIDIEKRNAPWADALRRWHPSDFPNGGNRVCVPMLRQNELVGVLIMGDRVSGVSFPAQDFDLLKCIADQAAAKLLNIQLAQRLVQTKELEAFQTMATFFVHDLKNAASTLNLMLQNLPVHFDDPAFREDALRGLGKTVAHINSLIARLGQLRGRLELRCVATDLNEIVRATLATFPKAEELTVDVNLADLPPVALDAEQVQKVVLNLLLNASEACQPGNRGEIKIQTSMRNGGVVLSVADNGCGMSSEFMQTGLFRPFRTTKKSGLGIGMFQSKMIIEAHAGNITVASAPGRGATFEIYLPLRGHQS